MPTSNPKTPHSKAATIAKGSAIALGAVLASSAAIFAPAETNFGPGQGCPPIGKGVDEDDKNTNILKNRGLAPTAADMIPVTSSR